MSKGHEKVSVSERGRRESGVLVKAKKERNLMLGLEKKGVGFRESKWSAGFLW
jgi:hypothetical protein